MLTLQELKQIVDMPGNREKLPTAKQLRRAGLVMARERLGKEAEISVYQDGYVLYQAGNYSTVFPLHLCGDYLYTSGGESIRLPEQLFEKEWWYLRLVLEGEDRLSRNCEEKERRWNVSYSAVSEGWAAMEDLTETAIERLVMQETVEEMLQSLTEKQKVVIRKYYMQEKPRCRLQRN